MACELLVLALMLFASHGALAVSYPLPPEKSSGGQRIYRRAGEQRNRWKFCRPVR